jgi:hypothetical protein
LLSHLQDKGFAGAPRPIGFERDGRERLSFIPGDVARRPWPAWWLTDRALASAAALLRRYHDAAEGFVAGPDATWSDELADPRGGTIVCHNDVCPENVVFRDGAAIGLIDFDFAAPGRAVYDLAQLAKMCVPLCASADAERTGGPSIDLLGRLRIVADAYRLPADRAAFVEAIDDALAVGDRFVQNRVKPEEALAWNQRALDHAQAVGDERVTGFLASLHLNLGKSYEALDDRGRAARPRRSESRCRRRRRLRRTRPARHRGSPGPRPRRRRARVVARRG